MSRRYDSARRKEQARITRERILDAAVTMHRLGVTAFEPIAEAADVSPATVRKHFPNKELLFQGCTAHFFATFRLPALEAAETASDPGERIARVTAEMCRTNEAIHDLLWHSYAEAAGSPTITAVLEDYQGLVDTAARTVVDGDGLGLSGDARVTARRCTAALLHPLTYRSFRIHSRLDAETTTHKLTELITTAVGFSQPN